MPDPDPRRSRMVAEVIADLQANLTREDRDLIVRYMVMRALGRMPEPAPSNGTVRRSPSGRHPAFMRRRLQRRLHAR